jgi:membrane protein DedA with SNARE-associated domain
MEELVVLLNRYGYGLLFGIGFLEFAGAPIASVPVLVVAGALASMGHPPYPGVVLSVALGGLIADLSWYAVARMGGAGIVDAVCGLSSNPMGCVLAVERRIRVVGPAYLLPAKFIPGAGNLVAAASGFAGVRLGKFILLDGIGLLAWATVYTGAGWVFAPQVEEVVGWSSGIAVWIGLAAAGLITGAGIWRYFKVRMHRAGHAAMRAAARQEGVSAAEA